MSEKPDDDTDEITDEFIEDVCTRLKSGRSVRRSLPDGGLLSIDRQLPFLCVYRRDPATVDAGTRAFANHEAAYLSASGDALTRKELRPLIERIVEDASQQFGGFLVLEVWAGPVTETPSTTDPESGETELPGPGFQIHAMSEQHAIESVNALQHGLQHIRVNRKPAEVDLHLNSHVRPRPKHLKTLISTRCQHESNCRVIGLEIRPIYRSTETGDVLPDVLKQLRRDVSQVLKKAFYAFVVHHTNLRPHHYYALGRSRIPQATWEIDRRLCHVSQNIDLLLLATPINAESSWQLFRNDDYRHEPHFQTRPLPFDPFVLKRKLMNIPTEQVNDPTLSQLFREVQDELDRQLTMLTDIGTSRFLNGSLQVFGGVEPQLLDDAIAVLNVTASATTAHRTKRRVGPEAFARQAEKELEKYRKLDPTFRATVELRQDMYSGLLVSGTQLLVGRETSLPADRVKALIAHEVGTHLVTRHNGKQQPMQLLQSGLAGYDPLQEGLAVLAEYFVGGLTVSRLRTLAARVVAAHAMINGEDFRATFRLLTEDHGIEPHTAYTIVLRVFRGGGLTKDAAYLRGLNQVLQYLATGGELEPLFVGKLALGHIPLMHELMLREVLHPPAVLPRYLTADSAAGKLANLRRLDSVQDLALHLLADSSQPASSSQTVPSQAVPSQTVPSQTVPGQAVSARRFPAIPFPARQFPARPSPVIRFQVRQPQPDSSQPGTE